MHRTFSRVVFFVCLSLALSSVAVASARPSQWQQVDVTVHLDQSGSMMLVSGELPDSAKLPAEAELSVPAGSTLQWIGQILGGDPAADPRLTYSTRRSGASDVYRFTLTKSREAQIEVPVKGALAFDGTSYKPSISWRATQSAPNVRMSVRVPANAAIVQAVDGAQLLPGDKDYRFYTKSFTGVKPGDELKMAFSYSLSAAAGGGSTSASSSSTAQVMVLILGVITAIAFILVLRHRASRVPSPQQSPTAQDSAETNLAAPNHAGRTAENEDETIPDDRPSERPSRISGATKRNVVTAALIGAVVLVALLMSNQATKPKVEGETLSQTFSQDAPCATATIVLSVPGDADPAKTAESVFGALGTVTGMNTATYNTTTKTLQAGYCESKTTEANVRQALVAAGLLADAGTGASATTTGTVTD